MIKRLLLLAFLLSVPSFATQRATGWCQQGGKVTVSAASVGTSPLSRGFMQSYKNCTVTVYLTGTGGTLATIYSDNSSTALANPFTADQYGLWYFYAADGTYDVQISGGGPPALSVPYTFGAISLVGQFLADQFPPGTNAGDQIQACLNALPAGGGTCDATGIYGTQTVTSAITLSANQKLILGQISLSGAIDPVIQISGSNATISCAGPTASSIISTLSVTNGSGVNPTGNTIAVTAQANNVLVENCGVFTPTKTYFDQPVDEAAYKKGNAIYVDGGSSTTTDGFTARGNYISTGNNGILMNWNTRPKIQGNYFYSPGLGLTQVGLFGSSYGSVNGNTFLDAGGMANAVYHRVSSDGVVTQMMEANAITGNSISGIYKFEAINASSFLDLSVAGNTINITTAANNSSGIVLTNTNGGSASQRASISGNAISIADAATGGGIHGIGISDGTASHPGLQYISVTGNTVSSPGTPLLVALYVKNSTFASNTLYVTGGIASVDGILTFGAGATDTENNIFTGNTATHATGHCFNIQTIQTILTNNIGSSCTSNGILISTHASGNTVAGNTLISNGSYGIAVSGTTDTFVAVNNRFVSNTSGTISGYAIANVLQQEYTPQQISGPLGIGTPPVASQPLTILSAGDGTAAVTIDGNLFNSQLVYSHNAAGGDSSSAIYSGQSSRGTKAAPSALSNGDVSARLEGRGYDGATYQPMGFVKVLVDGAVSAGNVPSLWEFDVNTGGTTVTAAWKMRKDLTLQSTGVAFASLPASTNGSFIYCTDCTNASNPCTAAGTGAIAKRLNGAWDCR